MRTNDFIILGLLILPASQSFSSNFTECRVKHFEKWENAISIDSNECVIKDKMSTINNLMDLFIKEKKISIDSIKNCKISFVLYFNNVKYKLDTAKSADIEELLPYYDESINKLSLNMTQEDEMRLLTWNAMVRERLRRLLCK